MNNVIREIRGTALTKHIGTAIISLVQGYVGVLGMRYLVALDERMLIMAAIEMVLGYASLRFFGDWTEFKGVAPISIAAALTGMYIGLNFP